MAILFVLVDIAVVVASLSGSLSASASFMLRVLSLVGSSKLVYCNFDFLSPLIMLKEQL